MNEHGQPKRNTGCLEAGQVLAWHDGALPAGEADEVMTHLAGCARCAALERALLRDRRQVFELLSRLDPPPRATVVPEASLARFQERLPEQNSGTFLYHSDENRSPGGFPLSGSEAETSDPKLNPVHLSAPSYRPWALAQTLVAVLVVAALLGASLLLFRHRLPSTGTPVTVHTQAGGLEMTMQITPGPYFLSELLAANLSLTNHSQTTYLLQGSLNLSLNLPGQPPDPCQPPLHVVLTGGERPFATNLQSTLAAISCNGPIGGIEPGTVQLQPGRTITSHQYVALTSSGHLALAARATFQKVVLGQDGVVHVVLASGPLDGHWPTLQLSVQPQVPSDRLLSLQQQGAQVIVNAPPAARGQLLYMSVYICDLGGGTTPHGGPDYWRALPTMTIQHPQCGYTVTNGTPTPDRFVRWTYVVAAPGYSIVSATYPS